MTTGYNEQPRRMALVVIDAEGDGRQRAEQEAPAFGVVHIHPDDRRMFLVLDQTLFQPQVVAANLARPIGFVGRVYAMHAPPVTATQSLRDLLAVVGERIDLTTIDGWDTETCAQVRAWAVSACTANVDGTQVQQERPAALGPAPVRRKAR